MSTTTNPGHFLAAGDRLFVDSREDWPLNACVGRQFKAWQAELAYIDGYRQAADCLLDRLIDGQSVTLFLDTAIYPALHFYRHHFELLLKHLFRLAADLTDQPPQKMHNHDLVQLWSMLTPLFVRIYGSKINADFEVAGQLLNELHQSDPNGQAARYPVDTQGRRTLNDHARINVRNLRDVAGRLSDMLLGLQTDLADKLENHLEHLAEMQQQHGC